MAEQQPSAESAKEFDDPPILLPCSVCGRTFRPDVLQKHKKVCERAQAKKRKVFDSAQQRIQGTEIAQFLPLQQGKGKKRDTSVGPKKEARPTKSAKWREEHNQLVQAIRAARGAGGDEKKAAVPDHPKDHEKCPSCDRYFGPKAYDRHVEWCKERQIRQPSKSQAQVEAQGRLDARKKYVPPLSKTTRILTKDKYSPSKRDPSPSVVKHHSPVAPKKNDSVEAASVNTNSTFQRSTARSSLRGRTAQPLQRNTTTTSSTRRAPVTKTETSFRESRSQRELPSVNVGSGPAPRIVRSQLLSDKRENEKYDPYVSAELQMLELFASEPPRNGDSTPLRSVPLPKSQSNPSSIRSSPSSAFAKFSPISPVDSLHSENKENNNEVEETGSDSDKFERREFSLSNLSLCSVVSLDSVDCNRNPVKRTTSARSKPKLNMQEMLFGNMAGQFVTVAKHENKSKEELDACEAELLISMMEFEKILNSSPSPSSHDTSPTLCSSALIPDPGPKTNSEEEDLRSTRTYADSAYNSLTRKTPNEPDSPSPKSMQPSTFCHECGAKYPVAAAKFCCQCGIRRLAI